MLKVLCYVVLFLFQLIVNLRFPRMAAETHRKSFTMTWRIENCKFYLQYDGQRFSPWFFVDTLEITKWRLCMFPVRTKNDEVTFSLCIESHDFHNRREEIELDYCFSVSSDRGSLAPFKISSSHSFRNFSWSPNVFVPKAKVFKSLEGKFLLPDVLTIQCRIQKKDGSMSEDGECTAITEPQVERISFVGVVENFSELTCDVYKAIRVRSASDETPQLFSMNIGVANDGSIFIAVVPLKYEKISACKCMFYMLDNAGNETKCGEGEFSLLHEKPKFVCKVPLKYSITNLMELGNQYLQNDSLSLQCEIVFSTGEVSSKITKTKYAANLSEKSISGVDNTFIAKANSRCMLTVKDDMMALLSSGMFSDVILKTATESFPVHKNILSARSPVFEAQFTNNMNEETNACLQIEDLEADIVHRFLLFMYSDSLPGLDFESAKKLYFAGDKYEVVSLKHKCSNFLQETLYPSNCCDVLMLADKHNDSNLKKAVQEYIARHDKEVFQTDEWKNMEKTNPSLTIGTFHFLYQKNRKNLLV